MTQRLASFLFFLLMTKSIYPQTICYKNISVLLEDGFQKINFCFETRTGKVTPLKEGDLPPDILWKNGTGKTIVPGFIDLQLNGAYGECFTGDITSITSVAKKIARTGVTSFSPTVITSHPERYQVVAQNYQPGKVKGGIEILGLHCEGPFITNLGVHCPHAAKANAPKHELDVLPTFKKTYKNLMDKHISMVTLAPDIPGVMEVIEHLTRKGIVVSLGHSHASAEVGFKALRSGATMFTHLFNAMKTNHHREPTLPIAALTSEDEKVYYGMIADFIHVHPDVIKMSYKSNPRMILVTDAMAGLGKDVGEIVSIAGERILLKEHNFRGRPLKKAIKAEQQKEVLAGSVVTMLESVNNLKEALGDNVSWEQVLRTATSHPAKLLGLQRKKNLSSGESDADFLVLRGDFMEAPPSSLELEETYSHGERVYKKSICIFTNDTHSQLSSKEALGFQVAQEMLAIILKNNREKKKTIFGLATGSTPIPTYRAFVSLVKQEAESQNNYKLLENLITYNLDEYIGPSDSKEESVYRQSYRYFMDSELFDALTLYGLKKENTHLPEPGKFPGEAASAYEAKLKKNLEENGGLDLQILGIGRNGHIGFAEPGSPFSGRTQVFTLKAETVEDNKRFFDNPRDVPEKAISMGIGNILEAKQVFLLATGKQKAEAIRKTLKLSPSTETPASALQHHNNTTFFLDEEASSLL